MGMSQVPVSDQIAQGYEPPKNTQFSVFLDNRCGKLLHLLEVFEGHALKVVALNVVDSSDHAVVRILTSRSDLARRLLQRHQLPFSEASVLVIELDSSHTLALMCSSLLSAELNIFFAYPLMVRPHGQPTIALHTDDQLFAGQILRRKLFTLLGENDLGDNATQGHTSDPTTN